MSNRGFRIVPTAPQDQSLTVKLSNGTTPATDNLGEEDMNKIVKLIGESMYGLAALGDDIEGFITSVEAATEAGYRMGGIYGREYAWVTADGLQGTPGTGTLAVNDYVVTGSVTAKGTKLPSGLPAKVCKATTQSAAKGSPFAWRVVSLGTAGTGAVGTQIVIERVASH